MWLSAAGLAGWPSLIRESMPAGPALDQPQQIGRFVPAVTGAVAFRFVDQAEPMVVPHGLDRDAGESGRLTSVSPSAIGSADLLIVGGRGLAYGLGDGPEVLAQNVGVVARDLRADSEVRVSGEHRVVTCPVLDRVVTCPVRCVTPRVFALPSGIFASGSKWLGEDNWRIASVIHPLRDQGVGGQQSELARVHL